MKTFKTTPEPQPQTFGNDLAVLDGINLPSNETAFEKVSKSGTWLPRFQLYGANSNPVKKAKIPMAHYGLVTDNSQEPLDLGEEVEAILITWRPRGMRIKGDNILSYFDQDSQEFQDIMAESEIKDSGCFYGPEYLIWLPAQQKFASYFANSKTARREAKNSIQKLLKKAVTFKSVLIETDKYAWHGPKVFASSAPVANMFTREQLDEELKKFTNPPKNAVEVDKEAAAEAGGRER